MSAVTGMHKGELQIAGHAHENVAGNLNAIRYAARSPEGDIIHNFSSWTVVTIFLSVRVKENAIILNIIRH